MASGPADGAPATLFVRCRKEVLDLHSSRERFHGSLCGLIRRSLAKAKDRAHRGLTLTHTRSSNASMLSWPKLGLVGGAVGMKQSCYNSVD